MGLAFPKISAELFVYTHSENYTNPIKNKSFQFLIYFWDSDLFNWSKSKVCCHGQSQMIKVRKKWGGWDRALLQFSLMNNVMKMWDGWICAVSSYNRVQGADWGQARASGEAAERAQIELDHKGPNMHWGPRYCQHSCPIQSALKGKSDFKTEFTCYSGYSIGYSFGWASLTLTPWPWHTIHTARYTFELNIKDFSLKK